jgi:hypothetical protein
MVAVLAGDLCSTVQATDSNLVNHVDWNIQNFVFREPDQRLFYVDLKPTTFVAIQSNEHNLKGIREYFVG